MDSRPLLASEVLGAGALSVSACRLLIRSAQAMDRRPMPYHFEFDSDHRILLVVLEGDIDGDQMRRANVELQPHKNRLHASAVITDASTVASFDVSSATVRDLAKRASRPAEQTPGFLVAPSDHLFGMGRMFQILADRDQVHVVRTRQEALAALGVQDANFQRVEA